MITIQRADKKQIDELAKLYDDINDYLESHTNYPGWIKGIYPIKTTAVEALSEKTLFVAIDEAGDIAGSVILNHRSEKAYQSVKWQHQVEEQEAYIVHTLVVHPNHLNQGIAESLLAFAKEHAAENKIKAIRLDVSVHNLPAIRLYEKCHFSYVDTVDLKLPFEHLKWFRIYEYLI